MNVKYLKLWRELTHADSDSLVEDLKNTLYEWEEKEYSSDKERWQSYAKTLLN